MSTFVLIPGAWLGGWTWQRVTPSLRAAGHDVYPITLTGLGERIHLARPEVGLETHVQDVVNVIEYEDLRDVVLLGHSYAGVVAGCVMARLPERIAKIVYLATEPPVDGKSLADGWSADGWAWAEKAARDAGEPWRWPMPANLGDINEASVTGLSEVDLTWLHAGSAPHPLKTMTDAANVPESGWRRIPHAYIQCAAEGPWIPDAVTRDDDVAWRVYTIETGHWPMVSAPQELSDILAEIAR